VPDIETDIQRSCIEAFKADGWLVIRQNQQRHRFRTPFYIPGTPDCVCCVRGRFVCIEFKQPGGKLSDAQRQFRKLVKKLGAIYVLIESEAQAHKLIQELHRII